MKLAAKNRRSAFVLILLAVLLLFTVVGFAAGGRDGSALTEYEENCTAMQTAGVQTLASPSRYNAAVSAGTETTGTEATATEAKEAGTGTSTILGYVRSAVRQLKQAHYIGRIFRALFTALSEVRDYWWIIIGVLGLIECFFGFRLFRLELTLGGFGVGFIGGLLLYPKLVDLIPAMEDFPFIQLVIAVILGVAGLLLTQFFFKAAVVIGAGYAGYLFSRPYLADYQNEILFRVLIAVCVAILAFLIFKYLVILATGVLGGVIALEQLTVRIDAVQTPILDEYQAVSDFFKVTSDLGLGIDALTAAFIIGVGVGLFGAIFQFATSGKKRA